jgi:hypothetical protein
MERRAKHPESEAEGAGHGEDVLLDVTQHDLDGPALALCALLVL